MIGWKLKNEIDELKEDVKIVKNDIETLKEYLIHKGVDKVAFVEARINENMACYFLVWFSDGLKKHEIPIGQVHCYLTHQLKFKIFYNEKTNEMFLSKQEYDPELCVKKEIIYYKVDQIYHTIERVYIIDKKEGKDLLGKQIFGDIL